MPPFSVAGLLQNVSSCTQPSSESSRTSPARSVILCERIGLQVSHVALLSEMSATVHFGPSQDRARVRESGQLEGTDDVEWQLLLY